MTSVLEGEKQLFEKFWRGTFKAVAMPRPESVIIASIAARRAVTKLETSVCLAPKPCEVKPEIEKPAVKMTERKTRVKHRGHKHRSHHHSHSVSFEADISTWPSAKRKKKKKNSKRKRRERSPSSSPSPLRKKKKKKKSSKKRKQHRSASKKTQHSTSNNRRKRKENRKHKKRSRSDSHHRHRSRKTDRSPGRRSIGPQNRSEDHKTNHPACPLGDQRRFDWRTAVKLANKTSSRCCAMMSECSVSDLRSLPGELVPATLLKAALKCCYSPPLPLHSQHYCLSNLEGASAHILGSTGAGIGLEQLTSDQSGFFNRSRFTLSDMRKLVLFGGPRSGTANNLSLSP